MHKKNIFLQVGTDTLRGGFKKPGQMGKGFDETALENYEHKAGVDQQTWHTIHCMSAH
jgi:hypothetical protein